MTHEHYESCDFCTWRLCSFLNHLALEKNWQGKCQGLLSRYLSNSCGRIEQTPTTMSQWHREINLSISDKWQKDSSLTHLTEDLFAVFSILNRATYRYISNGMVNIHIISSKFHRPNKTDKNATRACWSKWFRRFPWGGGCVCIHVPKNMMQLWEE